MALDEFAGALVLDKKKPHGIVTPPEHGAHYCQDGFYFGPNGNLVTHPNLLGEKARARLKRTIARKDAEAESRKAYLEALKKKGLTEDDVAEILSTGGAPTTAVSAASGPIDLIGWGKGLVKYPFFSVKKAFMDEFHVDIANSDDGVIFLVKEGKIGQDKAMELKNA
jgi:hypothetical protein